MGNRLFFVESLEILYFTRMDKISRNWGRLSLSERADLGVIFPKAWKSKEFIIAGKCFTPRALNMDAVGRTFKQLWRCSEGFKIENLNDHKALFVLDDE